MPSILCCPLLLLPSIFPSIRVFSNESALQIRWPKYRSFSFNISPSNEYSRLFSFRMDWLDLHKLNIQGENIQPWCTPFTILNQSVVPCLVLTIASWPQVSQEAGKVVWYSHLFKTFPKFFFCDPQVKGFSVFSEAEVFSGIFLLFLWSNACWQFDLSFLCLF